MPEWEHLGASAAVDTPERMKMNALKLLVPQELSDRISDLQLSGELVGFAAALTYTRKTIIRHMGQLNADRDSFGPKAAIVTGIQVGKGQNDMDVDPFI